MTTKPATTEPTDDEVKARFAQITQREATDAAQAREAELAPVRALTGSDAFAKVSTDLDALIAVTPYSSALFAHMQCAALGMNGLKAAAG